MSTEPLDLPTPTDLWADWARFAAALGAIDIDDVWFTDEAGHAGFDDHGGSQMHLILVEGGRAVLHGWDRDATFERDDVTRHTPPVDLFNGAPEWLPYNALQALAVEEQLGWLYWCEPGKGWTRAAYPDGFGDGSARMLTPVCRPQEGLAELLQDWVQDADALPAVQTAIAQARTEPSWAAPWAEPRPAALTVTLEEQALLAEAAAREGYEAPRPTPARTPHLEQLEAAVRSLVPHGARGSIMAWVGATSSTMTQRGAIDHDDLDRLDDRGGRDVWKLLGALCEAEAADHGRWSFVNVMADDRGVHVWRAYDTVPPWWQRGPYSYPSLPERPELERRPAQWRPDWAPLLDPATRTDGVPERFARLAQRVLGREVRTSPAAP